MKGWTNSIKIPFKKEFLKYEKYRRQMILSTSLWKVTVSVTCHKARNSGENFQLHQTEHIGCLRHRSSDIGYLTQLTNRR